MLGERLARGEDVSAAVLLLVVVVVFFFFFLSLRCERGFVSAVSSEGKSNDDAMPMMTRFVQEEANRTTRQGAASERATARERREEEDEVKNEKKGKKLSRRLAREIKPSFFFLFSLSRSLSLSQKHLSFFPPF